MITEIALKQRPFLVRCKSTSVYTLEQLVLQLGILQSMKTNAPPRTYQWNDNRSRTENRQDPRLKARTLRRIKAMMNGRTNFGMHCKVMMRESLVNKKTGNKKTGYKTVH